MTAGVEREREYVAERCEGETIGVCAMPLGTKKNRKSQSSRTGRVSPEAINLLLKPVLGASIAGYQILGVDQRRALPKVPAAPNPTRGTKIPPAWRLHF